MSKAQYAQQPVLYMIAGPNGSGKSTFTLSTAALMSVPVIDPDAEARILNSIAPESAQIAAGKRVIERARTYISLAQGFAIETTLAGNL